MAKRKGREVNGNAAKGTSLDILKAVSRLPSTRSLKVTASSDLTKSAIGHKAASNPFQFGTPSLKGNGASSNKQGKSGWTGLLGSLGSNSVSDMLGGGLLSSGLDYLVGGVESIFGGGSTSGDTVTRFEMSDTQSQTVVVSNVQTPAAATSSASLVSSQFQMSQASKAAIVQTVRNALLTSSSLNDVIGEL